MDRRIGHRSTSAGIGSVTIACPSRNISPMSTTAGAAFTASVPIRWSDAGPTGLLATAQLVTVMEEARVAWLLSAGEEHRPLITSAMIVTVDLTAHRHLRHDDGPIRVAMWIAGFRSVDFTIGYSLHAESNGPDAPPAYTASTQMAVVDVEAHTLRRLTDHEKEILRVWSSPHVAGRRPTDRPG